MAIFFGVGWHCTWLQSWSSALHLILAASPPGSMQVCKKSRRQSKTPSEAIVKKITDCRHVVILIQWLKQNIFIISTNYKVDYVWLYMILLVSLEPGTFPIFGDLLPIHAPWDGGRNPDSSCAFWARRVQMIQWRLSRSGITNPVGANTREN